MGHSVGRFCDVHNFMRFVAAAVSVCKLHRVATDTKMESVDIRTCVRLAVAVVPASQ